MEQQQGAHRAPRTWVVVAITLAAVAGVALVFVAGLATGVAIGGGEAGRAAPGQVPAGPSGAPPEGASGGAGPVDECVVGTWRTVEHSESADTEQGRVTITGVERTLEITADGTERVTYGSTPATVTTDQGEGTATYSGTVEYEVRTDGGRMTFRLRSAEGTLTVTAGGGEPKRQELKPGTGAVTYTCSAERLTQEATGYRSVMERVS